MSIIGKLFLSKSREVTIRENIEETKESILRLEILMEELDAKDVEARSHEKLLQIAFDDLATAIWGKDCDGHFVFMNIVCAEKILHTTIDDGIALTDEDFKNDALSGVCMGSDRKVLETGKTHRQIEYARYDDGNFVFLDTTKSPWIVEGKLVGTVGFGRIITDLLPKDVFEKCKDSGFTNIPVDLLYNVSDIAELIGIE